MKTRKLLLLVAGFMLFAFAVQAQTHRRTFTLKNNASNGVTFDYAMRGQYMSSPTSTPSNFGYTGRLKSGQSATHGDTVYALNNVVFELSAMGHSGSIPLTTLLENGGSIYTWYPGYLVITLCTQTSPYDVEIEIRVQKR